MEVRGDNQVKLAILEPTKNTLQSRDIRLDTRGDPLRLTGIRRTRVLLPFLPSQWRAKGFWIVEVGLIVESGEYV